MESERPTIEQAPLYEVGRIVGGAAIPATRELLDVIVEAPLLAACQELYDKNIRSITSSANSSDVSQGFAYINIDFTSLSDENRQIAETLGIETFTAPQPDGLILEIGSLQFPVSLSTTVSELEQSTLEAVKKFKQQPMLWAPVYQLSGLRINNPGVEDALIIAQLVDEGYFFDHKEQKFYLSEEHFQKTKAL